MSYIEAWKVIEYEEAPHWFFEGENKESQFDWFCDEAEKDFLVDGIPTEVHRVRHDHPRGTGPCVCEEAAGGSLMLAFKNENRDS